MFAPCFNLSEIITMKITKAGSLEYAVQNAFCSKFNSHEVEINGSKQTFYYNFVPNGKFFDWESDLLCSNIHDELIEFEIKATRRDFRKDFEEKVDKHNLLKLAFDTKSSGKILPKQLARQVPNHFYFLVCDGEIRNDEVPDYAGYIVFSKPPASDNFHEISIEIRKKAPILHTEKATSQDLARLKNIIYMKYWRSRNVGFKIR